MLHHWDAILLVMGLLQELIGNLFLYPLHSHMALSWTDICHKCSMRVTQSFFSGADYSIYRKPISGNPYVNGARIELGMMIFFLGLVSNIFHDDELREIRRAALRKQAAQNDPSTGKNKGSGKVDKVYMLPQNGLFNYILYPHYFCEWIEWAGFFIMAGSGCVPARNFLINEVATMLPRALQGKAWYVKRFGREKVGARKAIIPGIL